MDHLTTEARNPASMRLDELSPHELTLLMNREDQLAVAAVAAQADVIAKAIEVIAAALAGDGRLVYAGAGTSGRLGVLDATECPPTFNTPPEMVVGLIAGGPSALTQAVEGAEDLPEEGEKALAAINFTKADVFVGIATSGRTPYVLGAAKYARSIGARVIGLACNEASELEPLVDLMICPVVGPEVLSGSTRLKAGTATKLVLNTLTTGAMVRLGKSYGNLMVDLRATNVKLKARTNRIVRALTGVDETAAAKLLDEAGGELKTALVMHAGAMDAIDARTTLADVGGQVRVAMRRFAKTDFVPFESSLVLGIDGGGTTTVAILADDHRVLGRGTAGPSNLQAIGIARALEGLDAAIANAFAAAGRPRVPVGSIGLGMAGADRPQDKAIIASWVERNRIAQWCETTNDAALLLAAGTPEGWGIGLVAGTGSIAVGRTPDGKVTRCGGWGYLLGDEGSGYVLAMTALQAAARSVDGRATPTLLTGQLLASMGLVKPMDLIPAIYRGGWDRAALSALAPVVLDAAKAGDPTAKEIVGTGARELARLIHVAATSLKLDLMKLPVAVTGGTLLGSDEYRALLLAELKMLGVEPSPMTLVTDPALGAVRIARERRSMTV